MRVFCSVASVRRTAKVITAVTGRYVFSLSKFNILDLSHTNAVDPILFQRYQVFPAQAGKAVAAFLPWPLNHTHCHRFPLASTTTVGRRPAQGDTHRFALTALNDAGHRHVDRPTTRKRPGQNREPLSPARPNPYLAAPSAARQPVAVHRYGAVPNGASSIRTPAAGHYRFPNGCVRRSNACRRTCRS